MIDGIIRFYSLTGFDIFKAYNQFGRPILDFFHIIFDKLFYALLYIAVFISFIYGAMSLHAAIFRPRYKEKKLIAEKAPFVTVQIPTFNELAALNCASKCLEFDYPKDRYEIIIGDDSNNRQISKQIHSFAKEHGIKVTRRGDNSGFKSGNLNHMLKFSQGEILVLFDSDFLPEKDFLKRIVAPFQHDRNVSGVQARWRFIEPNRNIVTVLGSTIVSVLHHICLPFLGKHTNISFLCGSAEAVRKKDLAALGGWQTGSLTEDIEYTLRLLKSGKRVIYLDGLECYGEVPYTAKDLYKQQMRWAYGVIYAFREHFKEMMTSKILKAREKASILFFCSGYLFSFLLLLLFTTGTLSFLTHPPGPIDLPKFFFETFINIALTSGIILASFLAMARTHNFKKAFSMVRASFSVGLIVTFYVNVGIFKVLANRPMPWYMLDKMGNKQLLE